MSHRRTIARQEPPQPPSPSVAVSWGVPQPVRVPAGHCPRCGQLVGRMLRLHTLTCKANPDDLR